MLAVSPGVLEAHWIHTYGERQLQTSGTGGIHEDGVPI